MNLAVGIATSLFCVSIAQAEPVAPILAPYACAKFIGTYAPQLGNDNSFRVSQIHITFDPRSTKLEITYRREKANQWTEMYIADSELHDGDRRNTGTTYSAVCMDNKISIVRNGMLVTPLLSTFTLNDPKLEFVTFAEGDQIHATSAELYRQ